MKLVVAIAIFFLLVLQSFMPDTEVNKVLLGRYLFFDKDLSANGTKSCASCHDPKFAFTDGYRKSTGLYGDEVMRNTPTLINSIKYMTLNWANPDIHAFEAQMRRPLFGKKPPEMGNSIADTTVLISLQNKELYQKLFAAVYGNSNTISWFNIIDALAAFERSIVSTNSKYDAYLSQKAIFNKDEKRGMKIFASNKYKCISCHSGTYFSDSQFHITTVPTGDLGVYSANFKQEDKNKFRTPTLRNIGFTSPYMHDGSIEKLSQAVAMCMKHNSKELANQEDMQLIVSFLHTLSDSSVLTNKLFSDPFLK